MAFDRNDNAPPSSYTPLTREAIRRLPDCHLIRSSVLAAALLACLAPHRSIAQSTTTLLPDATVPSMGAGRIRMLMSFTRWDDYLGDGGTRNIGSLLATDSLGVTQVPRLFTNEADIRAASGLPNFRLTAGNIVSTANSRIMTMPLILEFGVLSHLTIGVVVPLVETRTTVFAQLNPKLGFANVGPNPAQFAGDAVTTNADLVQSLRDARTMLQTRLQDCITTPTGAGCTTLLAQQSAIQTLLQNSDALATAVETLYGTDRTAHPGQPFVPLDSSQAQIAVVARINGVASQYRTFLDSEVVRGGAVGAAGPGANRDLQTLLRAVGRDSLQSTDRASIGDVSVGLTWQVFNTYPAFTDTMGGGFRARLAVNGTYRFGTGQPANRNRMFDVATGYGQNGIEGNAAADVWFGNHLAATALASYTIQLGSINVNRVPSAGNIIFPLGPPLGGTYSAGNVIQASIIPRLRLAGRLALTGQFSYVSVGADKYALAPLLNPDGTPFVGDVEGPPVAPFGATATTYQQVGFGFTYGTASGRDRGPGGIPVEVSYNHLETLSATGNPAPKYWRDQIELRVFVGKRR
ncbi:MAG TPA: hypothetical protein VH559_10380 [Gemmatimonadaceae bacterium]